MVNFYEITLGDLYLEVVVRLGNQRNEHLDWTTITLFINRALQEVAISTLQYKEWYFTKTIDVTDGMALPLDYIKFTRVICNQTAGHYFEARYCDPKEFNALDYWKQTGWTRRTYENPIFTLWGSPVSIYLSPSTRTQTGTAPQGYYYVPSTVTGKLEYYTLPARLVNPTDAVQIPYDYFDYIVLATMRRVCSYVSDPQMLVSIQRELGGATQKIINRYSEVRKVERRQIDSFIEPVIPIVPPTSQEGEAKVSLV